MVKSRFSHVKIMEKAEKVPEIFVTNTRPPMDKDETVHISIVEGEQLPGRDMDADSARSSFISTNSSGTSGTSEADDSSFRDSVISYSSIESMDRNSLYVTEGGSGLGRVGSTRSMPPERTHHDSEGSEDSPPLLKEVQRKTLVRKTAIRRTHTLTPTSSPKVKDRRHRSISSSDSPLAELQKNKKEFVTFYFELHYYTQTHEVEVTKGLGLRDVIRPILATASIDVENIDVFIESSSTPTPFDFQVYPLSGRHLYVRAKNGKASSALNSPNFMRKKMEDGENGNPRGDQVSVKRKNMSKFLGVDDQKQPSQQQQQPHTQRKDIAKHLGIDRSPQDSAPATTKGGRRISTTSTPPVIKDPAKEKVDPKFLKLQQTLDDFMIHGLPDFPALLTFTTKREDDEECFQLEGSWRELGDEDFISQLTKKQTDQQEAIWEIVRTEVGYIKNIRIIVDFYLHTLINLQASGHLNEVETEKIFSNITAIEKLHTRFWKEKLSVVITNARAEKRIPSVMDLGESFEGFAELFAPYIKFCTDENECMNYLREKTKENEMLRFFIEWAQRHPKSVRRKLQDLLVYPMQRITKYPLLLIAVEKKTLEDEQKAEITLRISEVKEFVIRVNHELRQEQERQKMEETIERIEGYEVVSVPSGCEELAKLVEEHSRLDLLCSMPNVPVHQTRWLHMKGSLKLRDGDTRIDAFGFLFTDILILAKPRKSNDNYRIIKPPMRLDMIKVQELKDGSGFALVHVDEYDCAVYGCVLTTANAPEWMQKIGTAKELYNNLCTFEVEYNKNEEINDGFGEPPTSPEAMVFSMQSSAFPFVSNSPASSPLNSPKLPQRHLLAPLSIPKSHSTSSLTMSGSVSPVPEENGEDEINESSGTLPRSSSEVILSNGVQGMFPPSKRQSQTEDKMKSSAEVVPSGKLNGRAPSTTQTPAQKSPASRPSNLTIPPSANLGASSTSPSMTIMSFESDDEDAPPSDAQCFPTAPGSPQRKISMQLPHTAHPVSKSPTKHRRVTVPARPEGMKKSKNLTGNDDNKSKGLSIFRNKKKTFSPSKS